jgi:hypothetical protein
MQVHVQDFLHGGLAISKKEIHTFTWQAASA